MKSLTYLIFVFAFFCGGTCAFRDNTTLPPNDIFSSEEMKSKRKSGEAFCGTESPSYSAEQVLGKKLFINNCAACHNKNMIHDMTAPALNGVEKRWAKYPKEDLYNWIRNSQKMIEEGHPRAMELWKGWGPSVMNSFPNLSDEDIENLLKYIER